MNIYEKLQKARVELQNLGLKKSGYNKFANFDYFELKDFLPKVNEIFLELKLFSKFELFEKEAVLTVINAENIDEKEVFSTPKVDVEMKGQNPLQQIGSTHTYLKRYCYYNALEIIINDEIDATIGKNDTKNNSKNTRNSDPPLTEEEKIKIIISTIKKHSDSITDDIAKLTENGAWELEELPKENIMELYKKLKNKIKKGV